MIFLSYLNFLTFLVYFALIIHVLYKNPKSPLNRVFAALLGCFAIWSFSYVFIHNPYASKKLAVLFVSIASLGWICFASFTLWFYLIFTDNKRLLGTKLFYLLNFSLPGLFVFFQWKSFVLLDDLLKRNYGWQSIWSGSSWTYLFYLYYLSVMGLALSLLVIFWRRTESSVRKKHSKVIFWYTLITLIIGITTDVVIPRFHIIPNIFHIVTLIWTAGIVYILLRHKFLALTPVTAADKIISTMLDCLLLLDKKGNIVSVNKTTLDLSGYKIEELEGKSASILFDRVDLNGTILRTIQEDGDITHYDLFLKNKNGEKIPICFLASVMKDEGDQISGIVCTVKDVTERKKVEQEVWESREMYKALVKTLPDAVTVTDLEGNIKEVSHQTLELHGYKSAEELVGRNAFEFIALEDHRRARTNIKKHLLKGFFRNEEYSLLRKDGTRFIGESNGALIRNVHGKPKAFVSITRDITERKKVQKQLEEKVRDLKQFKDVSVDREMRMIELKKEVNELTKKLGQPESHDLSFIKKSEK